MGLLEKRKQTVSENEISSQVNTGVMILFEREDIEIQEIKNTISEKFGANAILQIDNSHSAITNFMLQIDGRNMMCSYMPFALPKEEGDISALFNVNHYISEEEQKALVKHKSFCLLTEIGGGKDLAGKRTVCCLLTKLCAAILNIKSAAGVYYAAAHLVLGKEMYLKPAV